jgi:hypothetical protein
MAANGIFKGKILYVVIFLILVAGAGTTGLYFWGKSKGSVSNVPLPSDQPNSLLTPDQGRAVRDMSMKLHNDMVRWIGRDLQIYQNYVIWGNDLFTAVYNDFNSLFYADSKKTLAQWIDGQNFFITDPLAGDTVKQQLMDKFAANNLL